MRIVVSDIIPFSEWKNKVKDNLYLRPVFLLNDYLNNNRLEGLVGFYLHGSLASLDYVKGYSDFDAVAVVKDKKARSEVQKLNRFAYLIDLLQHHPVSVIEEEELKNYNRYDLPLNLLEGAVALGRSKLQLEANVVGLNFLEPLEKAQKEFEKAYLKKIRPKSALDLKVCLSVIQLLPALYLQAKNRQWIGKKESFQLARKDFGKEWEAVERATAVRNIWNYSPVFSEKTQNMILKVPQFEKIALLYGKFIMPVPRKVRETLGSDLVEKAYQLSSQMLQKV